MTAPVPEATTARPRLSKLPSLTGLRFFAALLVFFFHITLSNSPIPPNDPINPFADAELGSTLEWLVSKAGYVGVSFFFVLSGFLLAWASKPGEPKRQFWRRRLLKIFPNHLVMWVLSMILFAAAINPPLGWISNLFLVNSFIPDASVYVAVNPPSWTLNSELLFYLLFPLLMIPIRKIPGNRLWVWAWATVGAMIAVQLVTTYLIPATPVSALTPISEAQFWFGYIFPPARLFEFILGSILARIVLSGRWVPLKMWHTLVLCVAGYVAAMMVPFVYSFNVATIVPVAAIICTVATRDIAGHTGFLGSKPMVWLGNISFGFYLCQGVVIFYGRILLGNQVYPTPVALLVVAGFFVATLLGGWALYALVEKPVMDRWARPRPKQVQPEPARATASVV
ncbi:acyltransferase family protein [Paenarthrobacter ilicis]|uniref:Peptidoglycan/LPS O-acetylase OafA/YrhL n=1 Tax=Paenarthrobacter ilicis TaxID=43665 RepID=A0ABX0TFU4_9MICC|nr:acyltransferase [Paenarthrobacter ilicis]MBM7791981.1 peptidoglycan/LPS O-acetylase OafA/YrhL [Paenarthrobacter ilicis]NIJ01394.1 peptidoglycan/LPS O-acetylase OafA/YrhL [Paenarthrobacter ilicis]